MAETNDNTEIRVQVRADLPREVDREVAMEAARRDCAKRDIIEDALRAYLKLPKRKAAA